MEEKSKNLGMSETEITALKQALFAQQDLLQKLYGELDVEREAASSAASEALSMILRLQGEKAAIKMEANQYKRLAEEKMCHAEEALAIFEDLIYQKETEIASLEYQVQAYKYKLLSLGFTDIGVCETKFPENLLQRNENLVGEIGGKERSLRRNSLPPISIKFSCQKKGSVEKERSLSPDLISTTTENIDCNVISSQIFDVEKKLENAPSGDINLYWEEIKKLNEQVREISDFRVSKSKSFKLGLTKDHVARSKSPPVEHPQISSETEKNVNPSSSSNVYDIFEVPIVQEREKGYEAPENLRLEKAKSVSRMALKPFGEEKDDSLRRLISTKKHERTFSRGMKSHSRVQRVNRMSEIVEVEGHKGNYRERGDEEFKLLKEIQEQLNLIQCEIRSMKNEKCYRSYEFPLLSLSEAMLHFWL